MEYFSNSFFLLLILIVPGYWVIEGARKLGLYDGTKHSEIERFIHAFTHGLFFNVFIIDAGSTAAFIFEVVIHQGFEAGSTAFQNIFISLGAYLALSTTHPLVLTLNFLIFVYGLLVLALSYSFVLVCDVYVKVRARRCYPPWYFK